ncbi:Josephin-domain-containing protein [Desarmillaria tabescens]|uniref:ubiquitinyl hydrolase 1 n=1 Tax=Armillaria tabescens TaxID=1929756 RepID=A0AA39N8Q4_ARMTA|nr:Josephin-domain-containing protein [Desarmillaria tabescens]KAK0461110.1 Josephin-domain-containing protein [Desarmillaria tabescens]
MMSIEDMIPHLYHEKQEDGSLLCAQHALNSLLRASIFTAPDLAEIARRLDAEEASYDDDLNTESASTNMDDTGFFSVQVLDTALKVWGLDLVGWRGEAMRSLSRHAIFPSDTRYSTQLAFILNYQQHWYTLRRFGPASPVLAEDSGIGHWFDLNSLLPEPRWISKTYLGMVLQQAEADGYSVFVVTQTDPSAPLGLPRVDADDLATIVSESGVSGRPSSSSFTTGTSHSTAAGSHDFEGLEDEDYELQAALQASLMAGSSSDYPMMNFDPPALTRSNMPPPRGSWSPIEHSSGDQTPTDTPLDPVAASMARNQQLLQRMTAEQQYAQRELWGEGRTGRQENSDDEDLRRAIAESEAMARAEGHGRSEDEEVEDDIEDRASSAILPNFGQPTLLSRGSGDRVYDDDDAELQAALKESLAQVPDNWVAPDAFQTPSPRPPAPMTAPTTINPPQSSSSALTDMQDVESTPSDDGNSTVASSEPAEAPSQEAVSLEEMRRRRLAKFGG